MLHNSSGIHGLPLLKRPRWPYTVNHHHPDVAALRCALAFDFAPGNDQYVFDLTERDSHATFQANKPIWTIDPTMGPCLQFGRSGTKTAIGLESKIYTGATQATIFACVRNFGNTSGTPIGFTSSASCGHYPFAGGDIGTNDFYATLNSTRVNVTGSARKDWWHVIAFRTVTGSVANAWRAYHNGRRLAQATSSSNFNSFNTTIGSGDQIGGICQAWGGFICDFRFFDRAMSDDEIAFHSHLGNFWNLYTEYGRKTIFIPSNIVTVLGKVAGRGQLTVSGMNKTLGSFREQGRSRQNASGLLKQIPGAKIQGRTNFGVFQETQLAGVRVTGRTATIGTLLLPIGVSVKISGRSTVNAPSMAKTIPGAIMRGKSTVRANGLQALYLLTAQLIGRSKLLATVLQTTRPLEARISVGTRVIPNMDEWRVYLGPRDRRSFAVVIRDMRRIDVDIVDRREF